MAGEFEEYDGRLQRIFEYYERYSTSSRSTVLQVHPWAGQKAVAFIVKDSFPKYKEINEDLVFPKLKDIKTQKLHINKFLYEWFLLLAKTSLEKKLDTEFQLIDPAVIHKATKLKKTVVERCAKVCTTVPSHLWPSRG